ncbi:DUF3575 domain-containing protein [Tenacibaculum tangerinum]|uniref:DUF3575 domain-containing protein n=1 Tax=Tenacibaculum tangerinum TaxID=3038772 RepID=A0ABY8L3A7_9FLAO|nr:DUF3575 domain-containing protein [Tenacibaculum tangerinum]WGH75926.1 DUF3575 domain-containing protein [Tenacibaculum tangerinum]
MSSRTSKKILTIILFIFILTSSFSQEKDYTLKLDVVKSVFGIYQLEGEYHKTDQLSYGLGLLYFNTKTMLFFDMDIKEEGYMISPFVRYYTRSNNESSSFFQSNLRYGYFVGLSYEKWTSMLSLDAVYGYQFKLNKSLFFEPSIGLGAFKVLGSDNAYGLVTPYLLANFNISIKI